MRECREYAEKDGTAPLPSPRNPSKNADNDGSDGSDGAIQPNSAESDERAGIAEGW